MRGPMSQLSSLVRLTRLTTAFAAVGNVWLVILWSRVMPDERAYAAQALVDHPTWFVLLGGALNALGLYAFGACLNDLVDLHRDRVFRPDRPLPTGAVPLEVVGLTVGVSLVVSVLGATFFDTSAVLMTLVLACAIMLFNAAAKYVPAVGLVTLGLIFGGHMLVPNTSLRFLWPAWLVMTHALLLSGLVHALARKTPRLTPRAVVVAAGGWVFWTAVLVWVSRMRNDELSRGLWPEWVDARALIGPAVLAACFGVVAWRRVRRFGPTARAADKVWRYGSLWLTLYATAWLAGVGEYGAASVLGLLAACGFFGMTLLREVYALFEQPIGYRR